MFDKSKIGIIFSIMLFCLLGGCSFSKSNKTTSQQVSVLRAENVTFISINGAPLKSGVNAVVIIPGRNELEFYWPKSENNFGSRKIYQLIMNTSSGVEYIITAHPKTGFLCAWHVQPNTNRPDFSKNSGCVIDQPF